MKHPTETELNEYLDGALEPSEKARMEAHLSDCTNCWARLASLQAVFQTLASLPEVSPKRDLTSSVLKVLPRSFSGLIWRMAFGVQAGMGLGILILVIPFVIVRLAVMLQGWTNQIAMPEVRLPTPADLHFSLPVIQAPHLPALKLPIAITPDNMAAWFIMGTAAVLLFAVGNISLIFHSTSEPPK